MTICEPVPGPGRHYAYWIEPIEAPPGPGQPMTIEEGWLSKEIWVCY